MDRVENLGRCYPRTAETRQYFILINLPHANTTHPRFNGLEVRPYTQRRRFVRTRDGGESKITRHVCTLSSGPQVEQLVIYEKIQMIY